MENFVSAFEVSQARETVLEQAQQEAHVSLLSEEELQGIAGAGFLMNE